MSHTDSEAASSLKQESIYSPKTFLNQRTNRKLTLGVLASGNGSNFEAISKAIDKGILNASIALLIVNNNYCNAINRAKRLNIDFKIIDHMNFPSREKFDEQIALCFKQLNVDFIIMAGWMRIVTPTLINEYPRRILNIHPSLLPSFKGTNAIKQALNSGVKITGCTVHFVDLELDSGPIIMQAAVPIYEGDDEELILRRIQFQEHRILPFSINIVSKLIN